MIDISKIKFDANGLVPAVIQEIDNDQVLMLAYMNEESLKKTIDTGYTWFFSRSRQKLWNKGETSGNKQKVGEIFYDCDGDTLLVRVHQTGCACHTGTYTCFSGRRLLTSNKEIAVVEEHQTSSLTRVLNELYDVIQDRKIHPVEGSYTNYLWRHGQDKILKKLGEEAVETIIASKNNNKKEILYEMGDLWYHCLVALAYHNIAPKELLGELLSRRSGGEYHSFIDPDDLDPEDK